MGWKSKQDGSHYRIGGTGRASMPKGKPGRTSFEPSQGIKNPGALTRHGYNLEEDSGARESALIKAVRQDGYLKTSERLSELEALNKNHPEKRYKVRQDLDFIRMHRAAIEEGTRIRVAPGEY